MRMYLASLGAGILMGVIYGVLHVRSPAPPLVALVGLLGMLVGEQILSSGQALLFPAPHQTAAQAAASKTAKP
jgi:XapX domain-containing protein